MPINQFSKIAPLVNNAGYLYDEHADGTLTLSTAKLKNKEIGICYGGNYLITNYNDKIINLTGGYFKTFEDLKTYIEYNGSSAYGHTAYVADEDDIVFISSSGSINSLVEGSYKIVKVVIDKTNSTKIYDNTVIGNIKYTITKITCKADLSSSDMSFGAKVKIESYDDVNTGDDNTTTDVCIIPINTELSTYNLYSEYGNKLRISLLDYSNTDNGVTTTVSNDFSCTLYIEYMYDYHKVTLPDDYDFDGMDTTFINGVTVGTSGILDQKEEVTVALGGNLTLALEDNKEYYISGSPNVTFTYPEGKFECYIHLSVPTTNAPTVTFPETSKFLRAFTGVTSGSKYEISIKNGIIIHGEELSL